MNSDWGTALIDEIKSPTHASIAIGPFGSRMKSDCYVAKGVKVVRGTNISSGRTFSGGFVFVTSKKAQELGGANLKQNDLVFPHRGSIGEVGIVPDDGQQYIISSSLMKLTCDPSKAFPLFIYYFFKSELGRFELLKNSSQVGTPGIGQPLASLKSISVPLPKVDEQKAIAAFLGILDDRITLLRETNATLEAIAQALFKSWFVDFDPVRAKAEGFEPEGMDAATAALFPDSFEDAELGLVPKGWRVRTFKECCERVESGGTPKRTVPEYWVGDVPWLTSGEVRNPIVFDTKEKISALGVRDSSAKLWPRGTTVVAMYGATAGEVCLLAEPSTANQACCGLIPKTFYRTFLFMCARREREALASKSSGSAQQNLNKGLVSNHKTLLAPDSILKSYESVVGVLLDGWIENERQAQTLTQLRDALLPRLISGQLRLPETEEMVEEVRI